MVRSHILNLLCGVFAKQRFREEYKMVVSREREMKRKIERERKGVRGRERKRD